VGRPSIDPELMIRILLVGYCYGIRSERRPCEEVHLNLAYRWFCPLGLCKSSARFMARFTTISIRSVISSTAKNSNRGAWPH
jgi:transposase